MKSYISIGYCLIKQLNADNQITKGFDNHKYGSYRVLSNV